MICSNCASEFEGNFCQTCGTPAPRKTICGNCGQEFMGNFCPNCGQEVLPPMEEICRNLYDSDGSYINVDLLAGIYLSVPELHGYFMRNTDYSEEEIEALAVYIDENVYGDNIGILDEISLKAKFEAPNKAVKAQARGEILDKMRANREKSAERQERAKAKLEEGRTARCPKCKSTSLSASNQGFGFGKSVIGEKLFGDWGRLAGSIDSKKTMVTCLKCGHKWKL